MINFLISITLTMFVNLTTLAEIHDLERHKKTDSLIKISGKVLNAQTLMPVKARMVLERLPFSNNIIVFDSDGGTGDYKVAIFNEVKYAIEVRAEGYAIYSEIISVDSENPEELSKDILLVPNMVGQILRMNKLFFKQSTAHYSDDSYEELNSLYVLLKDNPSMIIQLEGHTDYRGNEKLNMKLSQDRVESVRKYLLNKGIAKNRIKLKAYGGTLPLSKENSEEAQQMNRRVEVRILKK